MNKWINERVLRFAWLVGWLAGAGEKGDLLGEKMFGANIIPDYGNWGEIHIGKISSQFPVI